MVMSDISYSAKLRELSKDYYQNHLRFDEYRAQRKEVIDKIDEEFNGRKIDVTEKRSKEPSEEKDDNKHNDSSVFMKTIAFFKNSDVDE